ncbi:MAG TPA: hypothetical protein VE618_09035 [Myxococcaceae bacterium]|nr:hypothetical protein [Myxococcaceae bacterium]
MLRGSVAELGADVPTIGRAREAGREGFGGAPAGFGFGFGCVRGYGGGDVGGCGDRPGDGAGRSAARSAAVLPVGAARTI